MMFTLGLLLGGAVGYIAAALLHAAADEDERMGAWVSITAHTGADEQARN